MAQRLSISFPKSEGGGLENVVEDLTPQLGGNLDAQGNEINEVSNIDYTGTLKLQEDVKGNVSLFDTTDVSDTTDGGSFYVYRKAAEGDDSIRFYIDQFRRATISATYRIQYFAGDYILFVANFGNNEIEFRGSGFKFGEFYSSNSFLRLYGQITAASAQKYIQWKVDDSDDYLHLSRQDTNVLGYKIELPTSFTSNVGFYNTTPVAQHSSTGETAGFTAGSGTGVNDDSTFTGNVGSTAYRISDIVKALKNVGLIAS